MQWEKGEQEITQPAYLKVKEGYSDEMWRGGLLVFWAAGQCTGENRSASL